MQTMELCGFYDLSMQEMDDINGGTNWIRNICAAVTAAAVGYCIDKGVQAAFTAFKVSTAVTGNPLVGIGVAVVSGAIATGITALIIL